MQNTPIYAYGYVHVPVCTHTCTYTCTTCTCTTCACMMVECTSTHMYYMRMHRHTPFHPSNKVLPLIHFDDFTVLFYSAVPKLGLHLHPFPQCACSCFGSWEAPCVIKMNLTRGNCWRFFWLRESVSVCCLGPKLPTHFFARSRGCSCRSESVWHPVHRNVYICEQDFPAYLFPSFLLRPYGELLLTSFGDLHIIQKLKSKWVINDSIGGSGWKTTNTHAGIWSSYCCSQIVATPHGIFHGLESQG